MCRERNLTNPSDSGHRLQAASEVFLIFLMFTALAWSLPPDVNEAHYLAKARHLWQPDWCSGDLFLESTGAHGTFFFLFGWLTTFASLTSVAWIGRLLTWFLLAWSWQRLCHSFLPAAWVSVIAAVLFAAFVDWGHMAGEWILGGLESKGFAYALVFFALEAIVRGKWNLVWPLLGGSAAMHVLVGGWSVFAALVVWALSSRDRPPWLQMVPALLVGFLLSLFGLLPALTMNWQVDQEITRLAARYYVFERLSHHLVFHRLPPIFVARHLALIALTAVIASRCVWRESQRRLLRFTAAAVSIAVAGALIDIVTRGQPDVAAALLRFYWFRLSDAIVPLGAALCWLTLYWQLRNRQSRLANALLAAAVMVGAGHICTSVWRTYADLRPPAVVQGMPSRESRLAASSRYSDWRSACAWIARNCETNAVFLTPRYQQTFKWDAHRGEVVTWKDVPQDAVGILAWRERMHRLYPVESAWRGLVNHGEVKLRKLAAEYNFDYVVLDRTRSRRPLQFPRVYPVESRRTDYEVYRVPTD